MTTRQIFCIKPDNYEISKTRKYKHDISRVENMAYDEDGDCYYCKNVNYPQYSAENEQKKTVASKVCLTLMRQPCLKNQKLIVSFIAGRHGIYRTLPGHFIACKIFVISCDFIYHASVRKKFDNPVGGGFYDLMIT